MAAALTGCSGYAPYGTYLKDYRLAVPKADDEPVFEDDNIRVGLSIIHDRKFGLDILNKTGKPVRIFWENSTVVTAAPVDDLLVCEVSAGGQGIPDVKNSTLGPSERLLAEVYPKGLAYKSKDGEMRHQPLYYSGDAKGSPADLKGKPVGVKLVIESGGRSRLYPVLLDIAPSFFGF